MREGKEELPYDAGWRESMPCMDAHSCLTNRYIHSQTWVKEVSNNDVFFNVFV